MITSSLIGDDKHEKALENRKSDQDSPFIQFGSTKISLESNEKGGITVTVGRSARK